MTPKERVQRILRREPVDRLPTHITYSRAMGDQLAGHLGVTPAELPGRLDNHLLWLELSGSTRHRKGRMIYDWWGAGRDARSESYSLLNTPLAQPETLARFAWPDPHAPGLLDEGAALIAANRGRCFILADPGFSLFERAWTLRGFEACLCDLAMRPDYTAELLERITEILLVLAQRCVALGVDAAYFRDDYGTQNYLLFSPATWRSLFKPRLARLFAVFREAGLPVILHSDGQIGPILPDLVEIGLTALNPVLPEIWDHARLKRVYGSQLAFFGGLSTQTVLPFGSPEQVRAEVHRCAHSLAADGTGLLLGPSHRLGPGVPLQNIVAMLDAFSTL